MAHIEVYKTTDFMWPWTAHVKDDAGWPVGTGIGFTRGGAIRCARRNAARRDKDRTRREQTRELLPL